MIVLTRKQLNDKKKKKLGLECEQRAILRGFRYTSGKRHIVRDYSKNNKTSSIEVVKYFTNDDSDDIYNMIDKDYPIQLNTGTTAYYLPPKSFKPLLIALVFILSLGILGMGVKALFGNSSNTMNLIGENAQAVEVPEQLPNIIYQGFVKEIDIDKSTRYLSIGNSSENGDLYLIGVRILENDEEIYSMDNSAIPSGKYVNIDLYSLLDKGTHELRIIQYGYVNDKYYTPVSTQARQVITVVVK